MKAFKTWRLMPSAGGNRQQGRLMHDTESQNRKGKDRKSQETWGSGDGISHCVSVCV